MKKYYNKYLVVIFFFIVYLLLPLSYAFSQIYYSLLPPMIALSNGLLIPIGPAGQLLPVPPIIGAPFLFSPFFPFQITGFGNRFGNSPSPNGPMVGVPSAPGGYTGIPFQGSGSPGLLNVGPPAVMGPRSIGAERNIVPGIMGNGGLGAMIGTSNPMGNPGLMGGLQMTAEPGLIHDYELMGGPGPMGGPGIGNTIMGPPITVSTTIPIATSVPAPTTSFVPANFPTPIIVNTIPPPPVNGVVPLPIVDTLSPSIVNDIIALPILESVLPIPPAATRFPILTFAPPVVNPMQYNYLNLGSFGIYAPTDPVNFALINGFFPNGILTGPQTVVKENVTTVTTPIVTSTPYYQGPRPGVVDLNSIHYTPAPSLPLNNMIASPYVTIYGPGGILLSGPGLFN